VHAENSIAIDIPSVLLSNFFPLFQQGVVIEAEVGCTIKQMLTVQFGISAEYLAKRITTIFLNSKAVDDASTAVVSNDSVLALSGAMPGLVGATMRSGGYYAAMRGAMTHKNKEVVAVEKQGRIKIKLFNLLLPELGAKILLHGVYLTGQEVLNLLDDFPEKLSLRRSRYNDQIVDLEFLRNQLSLEGCPLIKLKVNFGD
jgi:hypothetical protein